MLVDHAHNVGIELGAFARQPYPISGPGDQRQLQLLLQALYHLADRGLRVSHILRRLRYILEVNDPQKRNISLQ